jgi:hypothetical protein
MTADSTPPDPQSPEPQVSQTAASAEQPPSFGWNTYAERLNGRFAMIGFVALLTLEAITHQTFFTWIGLF